MDRFIFPLIKYIVGVLELLLALRIILKFLGANANALAVRLLYEVTDLLVTPFKGIFMNVYQPAGIIDMSAVSAMIGYGIASFLLLKLLRLLAND